MTTHVPTREEAWELLCEYNTKPSLIHHALAVEAVMRHLARQRSEDEDRWGIIGLVHDLDYERFPDEHCGETQRILEERGWPEDYVRAVLSHGWGEYTDVEPLEEVEKALYAVDELTGLVAACALVRPSRSVMDLEVESVMKKFHDKRFAPGVNRQTILKGAEMLGVTVESLVHDTIEAMREVSHEIGL